MICVIALREPIFSLVAFACLMLALAVVKINYSEWSRCIRSGQSDGCQIRHVDYPRPSTFMLIWEWTGYSILAVAVAAALGQNGYRELTVVQWIPIIVGASIWMPLLRAYLPMMYTIADRGIWVQDGASRAFFLFTCLDGVMHYPERKWSVKGYINYGTRMRDFVVLFLKNPIAVYYGQVPQGSRIVLLTPNDSREFMQLLPGELIVEEESIPQ
jgi:hypothetical protein